jgi:hypothetical protein
MSWCSASIGLHIVIWKHTYSQGILAPLPIVTKLSPNGARKHSVSAFTNLRMSTGKNLFFVSSALTIMANATSVLAGTATGPSSSSSPYIINVPRTSRYHFAPDCGRFGPCLWPARESLHSYPPILADSLPPWPFPFLGKFKAVGKKEEGSAAVSEDSLLERHRKS